MSLEVKVEITAHFKKEAKRFYKKFPSLADDLEKLIQTIRNNPAHGTSLGYNIYKIRLAIKSKGKGKSGGARVITYVQPEIILQIEKEANKVTIVSLVSIYDKSETASISIQEIREIIREIKQSG